MLELNDYYPYGLLIEPLSSSNATAANSYKYQDNELNKSLGYNVEEFALRHYDPAIGRWTTGDPMEQYFNPYIGMGNNPANIFDPSGGGGTTGTGVSTWYDGGVGSLRYNGSRTNWAQDPKQDSENHTLSSFDWWPSFWLRDMQWLAATGYGGFGGGYGGFGGSYGGSDGYIASNTVYHDGPGKVWLNLTFNTPPADIPLAPIPFREPSISQGVQVEDLNSMDFYRPSSVLNYTSSQNNFYRTFVSTPNMVSSSSWDWLSAASGGLSLGELARQGKVYEVFGRSAQSVENALSNGQYIHTNGNTYSQGFRGNQYVSSKSVSNSLGTAKFARNLGRGMTGMGLGLATYQFLISKGTGADYARFTGALIITGTAAIPIAGPFISIGLGIADSFGAFDSIYNYFGN